MTENDDLTRPPAELKAALDGKLRGFSRNDAAGRAAAISKTYRDGGGSSAIRSEADALAYALARMPATYAAVTASLNALRRDQAGLCAEQACSMSAPGRARRRWAAAEAFSVAAGFRAAGRQRRPAHAGAGSWHATARACATSAYERGEARATLTKAERRRPRRGELHDRRDRRRRTTRARRTDVGKDPRHAAGGRTRHARGLCADHRAARATDRAGRACRRALPA